MHEHEDLGQKGHAAIALSDAIEHAEHVLAVLKPHQDGAAIGFQLHVDGLRTLLILAQAELRKAERVARATPEPRRGSVPPEGQTLEAVFLAGTILSCPECGEGLYKVTARATTQDLVLDNGTLLAPLNRTIPGRDLWKSLACPVCGGRLLKEGQLHTLQHGWH